MKFKIEQHEKGFVFKMRDHKDRKHKVYHPTILSALEDMDKELHHIIDRVRVKAKRDQESGIIESDPGKDGTESTNN